MEIALRKRRNWGFTIVELLPPIGLAGLMGVGASMLLPALAKSKTRANRIKCVSNIKQVGRAFFSFAVENSDRYPWLLESRDRAVHSGGNANCVNETSSLFSADGIKAELGSAKILVSPLDPDRHGVNDTIDLARVTFAKPVPNGGHSYGVVNGTGGSNHAADCARPGTVLTVTRNISGPANKEESLSDQGDNPLRATAKKFAFWKGADKHPIDARTMAGLNANAGQMGVAAGHASYTNDADLRAKTIAHHNEQGGSFKGSPSGFLDTPND